MPRIALLVDDEQQLRTYVSEVLRHEGFEVLEAADGVDGLAALHRVHGAVDVLVTDINMPRMTGIELVKAAKIEFPGIPVVYMSAAGLRDAPQEPGGRTVFLKKPFGPQAIRDAVRAVITPNGAARHAG